jgi:hypothetical protein
MSVSYLNGLCSSKFLKQSIEDTKHFFLFKRIKMPSFKRMYQTQKFSLRKKRRWHGHQFLPAWLCRVSIRHANMKSKRNQQKIHWQPTNEQKETWISFSFCCYTFWAGKFEGISWNQLNFAHFIRLVVFKKTGNILRFSCCSAYSNIQKARSD